MKAIVIDSCIFAKLFLDEKDYKESRILIYNLSKKNIDILVPSIFSYEIYYISQKYGVDLDFIDELITKHKDFNMKEISLDSEITDKAKEIIQKTSHPKSGYPSFYDSTYHALAMLNNCDFITADKKHYEKTKHLGNIKLLEDVELQ